VLALRDIDRLGLGAGRLVEPAVKDDLAIQPDPRPVVGGEREGIIPRGKALHARPPRGKVVRGDAAARGAGAPIEIDLGLGAAKDGRAAEIDIVVILAGPAARRGLRRPHQLPGQLGNGAVAMIVILHADIVMALGQADLGIVGGRGLDVPLIQDELFVYPQAHAVVGVGPEIVGARGIGDESGPADGEMLVGERRIGRGQPPVKTDDLVRAHHLGRAREVGVVIVLAAPRPNILHLRGGGHGQQQRQQNHQGEEHPKRRMPGLSPTRSFTHDHVFVLLFAPRAQTSGSRGMPIGPMPSIPASLQPSLAAYYSIDVEILQQKRIAHS